MTERLEATWRRVPNELRERHVAGAQVLRLPAHQPPWTATQISLAKGESFSLFAEGRVTLSEKAGLWNGPSFHLWARVGGAGPLLNGTRDTASFESPAEGTLELCIYSGEWGTRDGALATPVAGYAALQGGIDVLVVRWRGGARDGVEALAAALPDEPVFSAERDRLAAPVPVPAGWDYLWFLGPADIYSPSSADGRPSIRVHTHDDVGILQKPVALPFDADTRLGWRWRVDELPSRVAEDSLLTHDYVSVAVEFDDGQDLTYTWSAGLGAGTHYRCPLPQWDQRETHWVVRSGEAGLGAWHREERPLHADYEAAVGAAPGRIVSVWLIAVSLFQKQSGRAEFADVWLENRGQRIQVL